MLEPGENDLFPFPFIACNFIAFWKYFICRYKELKYYFIHVEKYKILSLITTVLFLPTVSCSLCGGQRRECILLGDHELVVLVGEVALDPPLVDEVGEDAGGLVIVHVIDLHHLQGGGEGLNRDLVTLH